MKVREYIRREHIGSVLGYLKRVGMIVGVILVLDLVGLRVFLLYRGQWNLLVFTELLIILLLLEGCLIGAAGGGLAFFGYIEYWNIPMLITGSLLIFLGLLVSFVTSV